MFKDQLSNLVRGTETRLFGLKTNCLNWKIIPLYLGFSFAIVFTCLSPGLMTGSHFSESLLVKKTEIRECDVLYNLYILIFLFCEVDLAQEMSTSSVASVCKFKD